MKNQGPSTQGHSFARWDALVVLFFCATTAVSSPGQTFTKVADLTATSGTNVQYPLVQGFDGNLYGTAFYGGAYANGTFFTVTPSGTLTTLHSFCKKRVSDCADGVNPGAIALGPNGKFYGGTANVVGKTNSIPGTIYKISSLGSLTTLHTFCAGSCDDGTSSGPLTLAWNGYFYGVSYPSAANSSAFHNVVFKVSPSGVFTTVLDVCPGGVCASGGGPTGGLFENGGGLFFGNGFSVGTTIQQALYKMTLSGTPSLAYTFCSNSEQCGSGIPSFLQATNGDIYGTFGAGGLGGKLCLDTVEGCGIAFRISLAEGTYVKLHDFCSGANCADGATPRPLIQAADGNLYGVTAGEYRNPQVYSYGTIFRLTPAGRFTVLHTFSAADPLGMNQTALSIKPPMAISTVQPAQEGRVMWGRSSASRSDYRRLFAPYKMKARSDRLWSSSATISQDRSASLSTALLRRSPSSRIRRSLPSCHQVRPPAQLRSRVPAEDLRAPPSFMFFRKA